VNVETKEQSKQWIYTHSPNKPKKFKQILSARKLMATVFWDRKGVLMVKFMQQGTTITSEVYCKKKKA
jgi:acyl-CoA thioesterase